MEIKILYRQKCSFAVYLSHPCTLKFINLPGQMGGGGGGGGRSSDPIPNNVYLLSFDSSATVLRSNRVELVGEKCIIV
jgi:hypothetical protein